MEKVEDYLTQVPGRLVNIINAQEGIGEHLNSWQKVEDDIEYFKQNGTFKRLQTISGGHANIANPDKKLQKPERTVLSENVRKNLPSLKLERVSEVPDSATEIEILSRDSLKENIKTEVSDMLLPQLPIKRSRRVQQETSISNIRSTHSKVSTSSNKTSQDSCDSDVLEEKQIIETITIIDSDDEKSINTQNECRQNKNKFDIEENNTEEMSRSTRTKTKANAKDKETGKRIRSILNVIDKQCASTKPVRQKFKQSPRNEASVIYEGAESNPANLEQYKTTHENMEEKQLNKKGAKENPVVINELNQTSISQKDSQNVTVILEKLTLLDQTVVVNKPQMMHKDILTPVNINHIMTDDDDDNVTVTKSQKVIKTVKRVENSPMKKHVETFEKLGAEGTPETPVRTTRAKTKAKNKKNEHQPSSKTPNRHVKDNKETKTTPQTINRYLPAITNSANKTNKTNLVYEKGCREKEADAIKKRNAMLQGQIEEKRKKRLEKQNKAQQVREALEQTKQKMLMDAEKSKEEKRKQILAEKQDKIKKQQEADRRQRKKAAKEEQEKLKQEQLKGALEEDWQSARATGKKKKAQIPPVYLRYEAPLLSTENCYDSDHEEAEVRQIKRESWISRQELNLLTMQYANKDIMNNFITIDVTTPNLQDIFENIDPRKLKRTSSAIWRPPPRFTLMP